MSSSSWWTAIAISTVYRLYLKSAGAVVVHRLAHAAGVRQGAEIAMATGTNVPASSNTSNSLAVRRYMTGTEPNLSPPKDKGRGPRAQAFAGYGSAEGLSGRCHPERRLESRLRAASKSRDPHLTADSCAYRGPSTARLLREAKAPPLRMTMTLTRQRPTSAATVCPFPQNPVC